MSMRPSHLTACCLALAAGCGRPGAGPGGEELGPGRFPHAVIYRTIAPWDGPATQLFLSEQPLEQGRPSGPRVSIRAYQDPGSLSGQRMRLTGQETRAGLAAWLDEEGRGTPLSAEIEFEEVREGTPVAGTYRLAFPDGKHESGRFRAKWWKAEGPGG